MSRFDVFATGNNGRVYYRWWDNGYFPNPNYAPDPHDWEVHPPLPGGVGIVGAAIASWGSGRFDVFATGNDGRVYHRWWDNGYFPNPNYAPDPHDWEVHPPLPGDHRIVGAAIASWGSGRFDVFATGNDGRVYHRWWDNGYFPNPNYAPDPHDWEVHPPLPGDHRIVDGPGITSWGPDRFDLFVTGDDSCVYHRWWGGTTYWPNPNWPPDPADWELHPPLPDGQRIVGAPAIASWERFADFAGSDRLRMRHVEPGDWRTLETTFNVDCVAWFRSPPGARIKVSPWLYSDDEQELDGGTYKKLETSLGKIQVLVQRPTDVRYLWYAVKGGPSVNSPPIDF